MLNNPSESDFASEIVRLSSAHAIQLEGKTSSLSATSIRVFPVPGSSTLIPSGET